MQAAKTRGRSKTAADGSPRGRSRRRATACRPSSRRKSSTSSRWSASAISTRCRSPRRSSTSTGDSVIDCANDQFRFFAEWDERLGERRIAEVPILRSGPIGTRLSAFLKKDDPAFQFDTSEGRSIGGRHYTVRFARLTILPGQPERCLISLIDKTAQVETERSLRSEMLRDTLTGLPNRFAFNERVEAVLADPAFAEGRHAVLAVDMTRFSRVNECMGAIAGDELLITFARRLVSALRPTRHARPHLGRRVRRSAAPRPRPGRRAPRRRAHQGGAHPAVPAQSELEIRVDCAIGCAILNKSVNSADEVLRNAQFALKRAKKTGATQVYEPTQAQAVRRRFSIETELRCAIEAGDLSMAYQPLIELASGKVVGFEALARWEHEGNPIAPGEFIPVAEESGLIVQLGRWALDTAVQTLADWDRKTGTRLPISVNVNLSPVQISRDDVAAAVSGALSASGIDGDRLTLELTEGAIIQDPERVAKALKALQRFDVKIAMDDFGTGFTSLASLQTLPIDILKIDQRFVSGMLADGDSTAIVRAILSLARALGMETTAEGIDSADLAEMLTELGCTYGQGFFYAEAMPADDALVYWLERSA